MEIGVYTFAETTPDPATGHTISPQQRLQDLIEEIVLADQVGLDVYGVGEHHRPDFVVSAPAVVLAAAASRTQRIRPTGAAMRSPRGALLVGSPQEVIDKILYEHELFGHQRFLAQFTVGSMPHDKVMRSIELLGTQVAPVVRRELGVTAGPGPGASSS